jgi:hypothetical protein
MFMMRQFLMVVCVLLAAMAGWVGAVEPNYVRTTTYDVDGIVNGGGNSDNDVVTTEYSDGLGRSIQSKLHLKPDLSATPQVPARDRVSCTFYDEAGRPQFSTKAFVDLQQPGAYLNGSLHDAAIEGQLTTQYPVSKYPYNTHLYNETYYWDDPLGQVKTVEGPGGGGYFRFSEILDSRSIN